MKSPAPLIIGAALLTFGCKKQEESNPPPVGQTPAPGKTTRRAPIPAPTLPAKPVTPPSDVEEQALLADFAKLAQEVAQLPGDGTALADLDAMQKSYTALIQRRGVLLSGMTNEQKRKLMLSAAPSAKIIGPTLMRLRLAKSLERVKNGKPEQPGTPQVDPVLGDLIPQPDAPPPSPPAPPPP